MVLEVMGLPQKKGLFQKARAIIRDQCTMKVKMGIKTLIFLMKMRKSRKIMVSHLMEEKNLVRIDRHHLFNNSSSLPHRSLRHSKLWIISNNLMSFLAIFVIPPSLKILMILVIWITLKMVHNPYYSLGVHEWPLQN